jgi:hypothetical protein
MGAGTENYRKATTVTLAIPLDGLEISAAGLAAQRDAKWAADSARRYKNYKRLCAYPSRDWDRHRVKIADTACFCEI